MDSHLKILDILIESLGAQTIINICTNRIPTSLPPPVTNTNILPDYEPHDLAPCGQPTGSHAPTVPGMTALCCERAVLGSPLLNTAPVTLQVPPTSLDPVTPPQQTDPVSDVPAAPKKVTVKLKKSKVPSTEVAKNLSSELDAAKDTKPPLPPRPVSNSSPSVIPETKTTSLPATSEPKKVQVKKAVSSGPRCEGRVYGDKVEMPGTKAPAGGVLHAYKIAQCERQGKTRFAIVEDNTARKLEDKEEQGESEGVAHLCTICVKRWEARKDHPENWHGFFDMDTWPDTSHFVGGAWYRGKMAKVTPSA